MASEDEGLIFDGKSYYDAAVILTDKHDRRFCDMLVDDFRVSRVERRYFTGDYRRLELMGWATFCRRLEEAGQGEWLGKIESLDEEVLLRVLGRQMLDARDKDEMDAALKGLQALLNRRKAKADTETAAVSSGGTTLNVFITGAKSERGHEAKDK